MCRSLNYDICRILLSNILTHHIHISKKYSSGKKIDDDTKAELLRVVGDFKQQFMAKHHSDVSGSEEN